MIHSSAPDRHVVHVIDDDEAVRDALAVLLDVADIAVKTFVSGPHFFDSCAPDQAGVVVADLRMPDMDGLQLQSEMTRRGYRMPLILISAYGDISTAVTAFRGGAVDFLEKPFDDHAFVQRVSEALARDAVQRYRWRTTTDARRNLDRLSTRERQVAALMIEGCPNKIIANRLGIGVRTVETHRAHLLEKLSVRTIADLMRLWMTAHSDD